MSIMLTCTHLVLLSISKVPEANCLPQGLEPPAKPAAKPAPKAAKRRAKPSKRAAKPAAQVAAKPAAGEPIPVAPVEHVQLFKVK